METDRKFTLGIDLGTSNSATCLVDLESGVSRIVELSQKVGPNQIGEHPTLPSALYLSAPHEFGDAASVLPWETDASTSIVGRFARDHGAQVPDRLVTSAKSWLSNQHVDPRADLLPWESTITEPKVSAFEASRRYLQHIREGFLHAERTKGRNWDLREGQVVLTVPASFDELARKLTSDAAEAAGFTDVVLLEEPQAAFYAWAEQAGSDWRNQVRPGDIVLVCDVGGGTSDFSLLAISDKDGNLAVERISVGDHILLGGDNMDLALAYALQAQLEDAGHTLDDWQFRSLVQGAGAAKVALLSDPNLTEVPVSLPSRGSSLFAGTVSTNLGRPLVESIILDGFFAKTAVDEMPEETVGAALQEFGLPYASDAVISKHLARFLTRSLETVRSSEELSRWVHQQPAALEGGFIKPTVILFNGGAFKAGILRQRVVEILCAWIGTNDVRELKGFQPDLAVAKGAASYARNRVLGTGLRIKAGTARSYYVGLESSRPAVPGIKLPLNALCVVPQGMEEGTEHVLADRTLGLVIGRPATFRFFSSNVRGGDHPGTVIQNAEKTLDETGKIEITLSPMEEFPPNQPVPVQLNPVVTELGNLELWMKHVASDQRWKVEFQVRME